MISDAPQVRGAIPSCLLPFCVLILVLFLRCLRAPNPARSIATPEPEITKGPLHLRFTDGIRIPGCTRVAGTTHQATEREDQDPHRQVTRAHKTPQYLTTLSSLSAKGPFGNRSTITQAYPSNAVPAPLTCLGTDTDKNEPVSPRQPSRFAVDVRVKLLRVRRASVLNVSRLSGSTAWHSPFPLSREQVVGDPLSEWSRSD